MKDLLAAKRYAQALFEIAVLEGRDQEIEDELQSLSEALTKAPELEKTLLSPGLSIEEKKKLLARLYGAAKGKLMLGFLTVLFEKGRFQLIHGIAESYKRISDEAQGEASAEIATAFPLDAAKERELTSKLEKLAGSKLVVKKSVDPSLIGGVIVKIRNKVFDGSVRGSLDRLKKELKPSWH